MARVEQVHRPSRRLGQNFLRDSQIATRIVAEARLTQRDVVFEPGAGTGVLTRLISKQAGRVIAVEKDSRLASRLQKEFDKDTRVTIIEGDFLRSTLPTFNKVLGTPPYYLSSKLLLFLVKKQFEKAHLVFQKEFGERLSAPPGTTDYGRLSVTAQSCFEVETVFAIPRESFTPAPKVDSILISVKPKENRRSNLPYFEETVRGLFNQRRRLAKSSLLHYLSLKLGTQKARATLSGMTVPEKRVFEMTVEDFETLSRELAERLLPL